MGLGEIQRVLAQLYTNAALRERFFADPQAVGEELGLSDAEVQQVAQLSTQQVNLFANSLHSKRFGEVCKLLPLTYRVLGKHFVLLFRRYAETYIPQGIKKHRDDAISFATFVEQVAHAGDIETAWVIEVLRYEKADLMAGSVTRHLMVYKFDYAIGKLIRSLDRGDEIPSLVRQPTIVIWVRFTRQGRLWRAVFSLPAF
jgi:hypothetical protein